jgi:hypothetical protein
MFIGGENIDFGDREQVVQTNFDALLGLPDVGEDLARIYAHVLAAEPVLAETDLFLLDETKLPELDYTVGGVWNPARSPSERWAVAIHGKKGIEGYEKVMSNRKASVRIMGEKCGLRAPMDPVQFAVFCTAHDFGHPLHCHEVGEPDFFGMLKSGLASLPVPGKNPAEVYLDIKRAGGAEVWAVRNSGVLASSGCVDVEELIEFHDERYRGIPTEDHADQFAVRVMRRANMID